RRDRAHHAIRADHLAEASPRDEREARGVVVGPETGDLRLPFGQLGVKPRPERGSDAAAPLLRIDGQADEVAARLETARLVMDLAVSDRRILFVDRDDAHALVSGAVPARVRLARTGGVRGFALADGPDPG